MPTPTRNKAVIDWVRDIAALTRPDAVHWCDGSAAEYKEICARLVAAGTFVPLNPRKRPNSFLARSNPQDVARVESRTFICCAHAIDAGPTNN